MKIDIARINSDISKMFAWIGSTNAADLENFGLGIYKFAQIQAFLNQTEAKGFFIYELTDAWSKNLDQYKWIIFFMTKGIVKGLKEDNTKNVLDYIGLRDKVVTDYKPYILEKCLEIIYKITQSKTSQ